MPIPVSPKLYYAGQNYINKSLIHIIHVFSSTCNRGLFKSYYCCVLFLPFENLANVMKNAFNAIFMYFLFAYFLTSWKMIRFFLQKFVIFNIITDPFLVEKGETLKIARR